MEALFARRLGKLAESMMQEGVDAFLAATPKTCGFLSGLHEGGHERFLALGVHQSGETCLICPALSATQAARLGIRNIRSWRDGEDPMVIFKQLATEWGLRSGIIAVDDFLTAKWLLEMQEALPAALYKSGGSLFASLTRNKSDEELGKMRRASQIVDKCLPAAYEALQVGATELQVRDAIVSAIKSLGGAPTFCIVAAGALGAEPHHLSDGTAIRSGDVVIMDFGCTVDGYNSDITRTVSVGPASEEAQQVYDVVFRSHDASREAARLGASCGSVDDAGRAVIEEAHLGHYFPHRVGHGIGLEGHEEPFIIGGNDQLLEPGHCFTIEPGVYLPGQFGVRIENVYAMTADGCESLNAPAPATLLEV